MLALPAAAEAHWVSQPSTGFARQEVSYVQTGGKLYLAGGGTKHQVFNPQTGLWSDVTPLPASIDHIQGVAYGGKIYYIGGLATWPQPHVSTVYIYNPATNTFSTGASMGARGRGAGGVAVYKGKIYYAGGLHNGAAVNWVDVYDPKANTWTQLPNMPTARDHFHAAVLDDKLWAIGGRNVQTNATTTVNEAFDFTTGNWTTGYKPLPTPRGGFAVGTQGDEVFVIGGENATEALGTVEAYNVQTDNWRLIPTPMPTPRHGIQAAECNGGFYVAAGGTAPGFNPSTAHNAFFPGGVQRPCGGVVAFDKDQLNPESSNAPTSLQFGPDERLYVAQQSGLIRIYTIARSASGDYTTTATETISLLQGIPNRDDDGQLAAASVNNLGRLVTGLVVTGTAASPVIYAASSDPRIGGGEGTDNDLNLDTNSGIVSKLTKTGGTWIKQDLVRGLPRSEENHTTNGLSLSADGNTLYLAQGGNTNKGAPSNNFANLPEYALSAAILKIDLTALGTLPYDLPTLNDPDRAGNPDANDPFGGNDGKNQAMLKPGGPVQVYAPGFRNPYDVVVNSAGDMYTIDNGGNAGWGDIPQPDSAAGTCTNDVREPGVSDPDALHLVTGQGYYGGHPNPTRANMSNVFGGSQTPIGIAANPVECDFRAPTGPASTALATFGSSTNGIAEYTASNFGGAMKGDLVAAGLDLNRIYRIQLSTPMDASVSTLVSSAGGGGGPLDVIAQGDDDEFPGTIWFVDIYDGGIYVLEPTDFDGGSSGCDLNQPDADNDGFSNSDEQANGTSPCSSADTPPDVDGDHVSDRTDTDDDNDTVPDKQDPFAGDAQNGLGTNLPVNLEWENDSPSPGGLLNLGFTGLMLDPGGTTDYLDQFDRTKMTTGGAAGVVTVDEVPAGDAYEAINSQQYGFQVGFKARPADGAFSVHTRIMGPFGGLTPADYQSMGVFVGPGDQDNYVKITTGHVGGTVVEALSEFNGDRSFGATEPLTMGGSTGPQWVDLYLRVDPSAGTVQPSFTSTKAGLTSARKNVGGPLPVPAGWFTSATRGVGAGMISTSNGGNGAFPASWDFLKVTRDTPPPVVTPTPTPTPTPDETATPDPTATAEPTVTPAPTVQPPAQRATVKVKAAKLRTALKNGLALELSCPAACTLTARLQLPAKSARALKLGRKATYVARGTVRMTAAGKRTLRVKFTRAAKRRLARLRRVDLVLVLDTVEGGKRAKSTRKVRLKR
jgi:hypothetical protein